MRAMREQLRDTTIFDWLDAILERADELMRAREAGVASGEGSGGGAAKAEPDQA